MKRSEDNKYSGIYIKKTGADTYHAFYIHM